jgi:lipoprotein LprG
MSRHPSSRRLFVLAAATLALAVPLAGCGGSSGGGGSKPADITAVLTKAKNAFDAATSVHFTMATNSRPTSGDAVLGADGTLTHQPAFKGTVKVQISGFSADVPVVSVDGKVHAKLPLTPAYATINPGDYGAPNPADFADPSKGISGLLLDLKGAKQTGQQRNGNTVVTTYSGTLSGDLVKPIIPSASASGTYQTVVGIDQTGVLTTLQVTGRFFTTTGDVTYNLVFGDYGKNVTISAP